MSLNFSQLKEYTTLNDLINRHLVHYNWNLNVLSPANLLDLCRHKGIEYQEKPLGASITGYYRTVNGLPEVVVNSDLTDTAKWFAMACKIASHFTTEPCRARALGAIALMPTWMLRDYTYEDLTHFGYCDQFLLVRQQAATSYPDVPRIKYPFTPDPVHVRTFFK